MDKKSALQLFLDKLNIEDEGFLEDLNAVSMLISKRKRELLFLENNKGNEMFFVVSGLIKIFKTGEDGKEIVLNIAKEGEMFAEVVLFLKNIYPASAMAITDTLLLSINTHHLFERIKRKPEFAMKLLGIFAQRIKYLVEKIKELSGEDAEEKIINYLYSLKDKNNTVVLDIPKKDIATLLGLTAETFSRTLKRLSSKGLIKMNAKRIELLQ
ncbi:Crp/Fnr family transcriptional regulator [Hippea maritima]|uniref:Transcriptional regulator, Crp/Fnr family n=1 Tax=Hippea maritima (strain ATCC 700847 / DSM 10411 / MH2) TaxID=760142 RepID=F2LX39_HIPMA|nr:Crp/Fnr family transcriptional regulator [Hippea maritima]AEA33097.1 transcriptional regulator, Crp/Fnr family [Hippea maritima DSM 10411]